MIVKTTATTKITTSLKIIGENTQMILEMAMTFQK
jgi:hypothetical protein